MLLNTPGLAFKDDEQQPDVTNHDERLLPFDVQPFCQRATPDDSNKDLTEETGREEPFESPSEEVEKVKVVGEDEERGDGRVVIDELRRHRRANPGGGVAGCSSCSPSYDNTIETDIGRA